MGATVFPLTGGDPQQLPLVLVPGIFFSDTFWLITTCLQCSWQWVPPTITNDGRPGSPRQKQDPLLQLSGVAGGKCVCPALPRSCMCPPGSHSEGGAIRLAPWATTSPWKPCGECLPVPAFCPQPGPWATTLEPKEKARLSFFHISFTYWTFKIYLKNPSD